MGNYLVKENNDNIINESYLGIKIKESLKPDYKTINEIIDWNINNRNEQKVIPKETNIDLVERSCCLGLNSSDNFITVKVPKLEEDGSFSFQKLGYEMINGKEEEEEFNNLCKKMDLIPGQSKCNKLMVDKCAKSLYDAGCMECKEKSKDSCTPIWSKNSRCILPDKSLAYGNEECACINSFSGFTLNTNPSSSIKTDIFEQNQNPYGVVGNDNNDFTKYSLNIFNNPSELQKPPTLDTRCSERIAGGSRQSGKSKPYLLPGYDNPLTLCLNQINIGNSDIGEANFSNIKQQNNCGGVSFEKEEEEEVYDEEAKVETNEEPNIEEDQDDNGIDDKFSEIVEQNKLLLDKLNEKPEETTNNNNLLFIGGGALLIIILILIIIIAKK